MEWNITAFVWRGRNISFFALLYCSCLEINALCRYFVEGKWGWLSKREILNYKFNKKNLFFLKKGNIWVIKFIHSIQLLNFTEKFSPLPGFEPWTSTVPSRYATNWAILAWISREICYIGHFWKKITLKIMSCLIRGPNWT